MHLFVVTSATLEGLVTVSVFYERENAEGEIAALERETPIGAVMYHQLHCVSPED
jgi:hypothetical protein